MDISKLILRTRRKRINQLVVEMFDGNRTRFADAVDMPKSQVSQFFDDSKPHGRNIGEKVARKIEEKLNLPYYWLDKVPADAGDDRLCTESADQVLLSIKRDEFLQVRAFLYALREQVEQERL